MPFRPALHAASFFSPFCAISKFELLCCGTHYFPTNSTRENLECERRQSVIFSLLVERVLLQEEEADEKRKKLLIFHLHLFHFARSKGHSNGRRGRRPLSPKLPSRPFKVWKEGKLQVVKTRTFVQHHELPRPEEIFRDQNSFFR